MFQYYTIAVVAILAAMSPGPDFFIVSKHALMHSRYNAIMASIGIGVGILIHSIYCILGLAIIISQSILLFSIIKYLGAAYLIYLGVKNLFTHSVNNQLPEAVCKQSGFRAFTDGLVTNLLNPKCTLFMLSVFTLVISPQSGMLQKSMLSIEISLIHIVWFGFLSIGLTTYMIKKWISNIQNLITKVIGVVLIGLGILVASEYSK